MNRQLTQNAHSEWFLQPNCYCIVFCEKTLTMKAISENFQQILDADAALYLNKVLKSIFQENEIEAFLRATKNLKEGEMHLLNLATSNTWGGYNIYISTIAEHYLLEFEKKSTQAAKENQLRNTLAQIEQLKNEPQCIHDLLANIGRNVNADRTLYLRFDLKGNADTVDEYTKEGTLPYFKGLKIPKNDFPWYLKLLLSTQRLHFTQHCLLNPVKILTVSTFNFSFEKTASQSLSKYHLNYLKSLGLKSCIYLPIYFDNNLWGSLVFFFNKEKILPSSERNYLEIISSFLGHKVNILVEKQKAINRNGRSRIENAILKKIVEENYFLDAFKETENELLKIANAIGMVVIYEDDIHFFGNTPSKDKINRLQSWVFEKAPKDIYYTESLASDFSAFLPIKKDFCGLLAVPLSNLKPYYTNLKPYYIFWFRPEVNKVLKWSGNPNRNAQNDDEELPTFVYESSSNWKMVFAGKSKPWKKSTINAILNIQNITLKSLKNRRDIIYKQLAKEQIIYKNSPELLLIFKEDFSIKIEI